MKKKGFFIFLIFIILIAGLFPFNRQVAIKVKASYFNCYQQLFSIKNWKNWNPHLSKSFKNDPVIFKGNKGLSESKISTPEGDLWVKEQSSSTLLVKQDFKDDKLDYTIILVPDEHGFAAIVITTFKTNLIKFLMSAIQTHELEKMSISNFKNYMEDVKQYYGFNIKEHFESEKMTIVKSKTIATGNVYAEVAEMQKQLRNYISIKHLKTDGSVIAQFYKKSDDSLRMIIGLPVDKEIKADNGFINMRIPQTKVLTANFNGKYCDKQKIYAAMFRYVQDRFLHPKIAPLEFFKNKFPTGDSDEAGFQLCYPIF